MARKIKAKNPAAVALGKLGGPKGGRARMAQMTAAQRTEFARQGGQASRGKLTAAQRSEIARKAGLAGGRGRKRKEEK